MRVGFGIRRTERLTAAGFAGTIRRVELVRVMGLIVDASELGSYGSEC